MKFILDTLSIPKKNQFNMWANNLKRVKLFVTVDKIRAEVWIHKDFSDLCIKQTDNLYREKS